MKSALKSVDFSRSYRQK